jgi:hypothetical protein
MRAKLTHEDVSDYYKNNGYILTSEYKNFHYKNNLICPNNHNIDISFAKFKQGRRCRECNKFKMSEKFKFSQEYVENYYKQFGYVLKSKYINNGTKNNLICPEGHNIEMIFNSFKTGYRCSKCAGVKKLDHDYVKKYYKDNNYELKSIYTNNRSKDRLICPEGHEIEMTFNNFKNQNRRCRICYLENNIGESHTRYNKDRTRRIRSNYLQFDLKKINILKDEPLYESYLLSQQEAKDSDKDWDTTKYSVDHIFPRIAFIDSNLDNLYNLTVIKEICNSRDNLRIILKEENGSKGGKYNQEEFINWFNKKLEEYNVDRKIYDKEITSGKF